VAATISRQLHLCFCFEDKLLNYGTQYNLKFGARPGAVSLNAVLKPNTGKALPVPAESAKTAMVSVPNVEWSKDRRSLPDLGGNSLRMVFRSRTGKRFSVTVRRILTSPVQRFSQRLRPLALSETSPRVDRASTPVRKRGRGFFGMYVHANDCTRRLTFCMVFIRKRPFCFSVCNQNFRPFLFGGQNVNVGHHRRIRSFSSWPQD
jgi:hypothetical protein